MRISDWSSDVCAADLIYRGSTIEERRKRWNAGVTAPRGGVGIKIIQNRAGARLVCIVIVVDRHIFHALERLQQQRRPKRFIMSIIEVGTAAQIFRIAVAARDLPREATCDFLVDNGKLDSALEATIHKVAQVRIKITLQLVGRRRTVNQDSTSCSVTADQRALGTLAHLD